MAYSAGQPVGGGTGPDRKFVELLISDLISLSYETKRKYPPVKEAAEACQLKARSVGLKPDRIAEGLLESSAELVQPFVLGCDTKNPKIVQLSLTAMQRLIGQQCISQGAANSIITALWVLMEAGVEELKLLQTATLLVTTSPALVQHELLARVLVLCFRLHYSKDTTVTHTAAATVRQLVCCIFERVADDDSKTNAERKVQTVVEVENTEAESKRQVAGVVGTAGVGGSGGGKSTSKNLGPAATDAYLLFQDFCQLLNADQPQWLLGLTEMTLTLCLELIEEVLTNFHVVFLQHVEFNFMLTEKVCPLVIKLFSPSLKYRASRNIANNAMPSQTEKPCFPIVMRLLRVVSVLVRHYYRLLVTECEIFLSLLVKFLDPEKPAWQRATTLEVLAKLCTQPVLIRSFCESYDMKPHATKILRDIVNGLSAFVQSQFLNIPAGNAPVPPPPSNKAADLSSGSVQVVAGGVPVVGGVTPQPGFNYRNVWIPLVVNINSSCVSHKPIFMDMLDKLEAPVVPEGYGLSLAFLCLLDIINCINGLVQINTAELSTVQPLDSVEGTTQVTAPGSSQVQSAPSGVAGSGISGNIDAAVQFAERLNCAAATGGKSEEQTLHEELITSSWCGVLAALSMLLDGCTDEQASEAILKAMQSYASISGRFQMCTPRDAFITALCKASLPPHYALHILNSPAELKGQQARAANQSSDQSAGSAQGSYGWGAGSYGAGGSCNVDSLSGGNSQVVAVGSALPSVPAHGGGAQYQQGPVMLTAKNIQCMRGLLSLAHCHGGVLGTAWHQVLTTLQHLVWILGMKPSTGGSLKSTVLQTTDNSSHSSSITTAVMSDMPVIASMLSRLFESSQYLDDVALHHLLDALIKLSAEAMDVGYANREPSLFAVAKLLETALVNLTRIEVLWRPVTNHLLEVCQHPNQGLRCWAGEVITTLIKAALVHKYDATLRRSLQQKLLAPLQEMSSIQQTDIRQKQLECVLYILQTNGDELCDGWPLCLNVIGSVTSIEQGGDTLIRIAFQSLQLVVTDFLPTMPCSCLQVCVDVTAKFGLQFQDLNISLTAVGLLWNIADFFSQNRTRICQQLGEANQLSITSQSDKQTDKKADKQTDKQADGQTDIQLAAFDALWMVLYCRLGELCVDLRPAVRKSAGQTLFSMLAAHGSLLQQQSWQTVLWKVLFPLLDRVNRQSTIASDNKDEQGAGGGGGAKTVNILMHHSRDTAEKQWAETRFLTLAGVCRVFNMKSTVLRQLGDFLRAWALLLEYIESAALCHNAEVSLAALKSFQELLNINTSSNNIPPPPHSNGSVVSNGSRQQKQTDSNSKQNTSKSVAESNAGAITHAPHSASLADAPTSGDAVSNSALWSTAWHIWRNIGTTATCPPPEGSSGPLYIPSQAFLTALVQTFPALYAQIKQQFVTAELQRLFIVLHRALCVPIHNSATLFLVPVGGGNSGELSALTPLQDAVLGAIKVLTNEATACVSGSSDVAKNTKTSSSSSTASSSSSSNMYPDLFERLVCFIELSVHSPKYNKADNAVIGQASLLATPSWPTIISTGSGRASGQSEYVSMNYVPFAEAVIELVVNLYKCTAKLQSVIQAHTLQLIIHSLRLLLSLKYGCPSQSTWLLAINSLMTLLSVGLPIANKNEAQFQGMWLELGCALEEFLFSPQAPPHSMSVDEFQCDEAIDCRVIQLIRDDILPNASKLPHEFIVKIMSILNKGSIHSVTTSSFIDIDSNQKLREEFAKICFETLLQFSFISHSPTGGSGRSSKDGGVSKEDGAITHLAIESLLHRCKNVLEKFVADERLSGKCPLPRPRMTEMSFVLKAVGTLVTTLKRTPPNTVDNAIWDQVIDLYPSLVDCTASSSANVCKSLRDALMEYKDLLARPSALHNGTAATK